MEMAVAHVGSIQLPSLGTSPEILGSWGGIQTSQIGNLRSLRAAMPSYPGPGEKIYKVQKIGNSLVETNKETTLYIIISSMWI